MPRRPIQPHEITCADCGRKAMRKGIARYCERCSIKRSQQRGAAWARSNPLTAEQTARRILVGAARRELLREAGAKTDTRRALTWMAAAEPSLVWLVRVRIPFSVAFSKNHIWTMRRGANGLPGHMFMRRESSQARAELADALRTAIGAQKVAQNRLWLDILVQKPSARSDAINVLDLVADAVQDATGLNDSWYAVRRIDWEIVKEEPDIFVGIGQESTQSLQACSYCGQLLPLTAEAFGRNRSMQSGLARVCRPCSRITQRGNA